jgi:pantoate kinase
MSPDGEAVIPLGIAMGAHLYEVRYDPDTAALLQDEGALGDSHADRLLIRLDPSRPHTAVAETLLHELMHCAFKSTPLRTDDVLAEQEEAIVTALTPPMLDALRRNPALVDYLTA